jgi:hypothetical protein
LAWDPRTGQERWRRPHTDYSRPGFSPDGTRLVTLDGGTVISIVDAASGGSLATLDTGGPDPLTFLALAPDGEVVAAIRNGTELLLLRVITGETLASTEVEPGRVPLQFSPDGQQLAVGGDGTRLLLFDTSNLLSRTLETIAGYPGGEMCPHVRQVAFSRTGARLALIAGCWFQVWEVGEEVTLVRSVKAREPVCNGAQLGPPGMIPFALTPASSVRGPSTARPCARCFRLPCHGPAPAGPPSHGLAGLATPGWKRPGLVRTTLGSGPRCAARHGGGRQDPRPLFCWKLSKIDSIMHECSG